MSCEVVCGRRRETGCAGAGRCASQANTRVDGAFGGIPEHVRASVRSPHPPQCRPTTPVPPRTPPHLAREVEGAHLVAVVGDQQQQLVRLVVGLQLQGRRAGAGKGGGRGGGGCGGVSHPCDRFVSWWWWCVCVWATSRGRRCTRVHTRRLQEHPPTGGSQATAPARPSPPAQTLVPAIPHSYPRELCPP